ncbi:MAG: trypsin-like peptidase domain-containing protein [Defluviitaleaceae bacterium]|nr:trypsin-like peptidase domain-containing protein [Defluviitaleaceae bacterium]
MMTKSVWKMVVAMLCAAVVAFGGGYAGAQLALRGVEARGYESIHAHHPGGLTADALSATPAYTAANRQALTLPDLFDGANPAVVAISIEVTGRNAFGQTVTRPASGSGFFISPDGYIVTNDHVIENAENITVLLYDGSQYPAVVVGRDAASDIAVIWIDVTERAHLAFGDSDVVRVGDQVAAIGNPLGELANSMTVGVISALDRDIAVDGVTRIKLQTDAAVNRGNSGGPLLNLYGEVIGVVNAKSVGTDVEGLGFAIPSNEAMEIVGQLMEYGFIRGRAILGITINEITQAGTLERKVQVSSVNPGGAAYAAGLKAGDVVLAVNGMEVFTFDTLRAVLSQLSPGDEVAVRIQRSGAEMYVYVILDEYRPHGL